MAFSIATFVTTGFLCCGIYYITMWYLRSRRLYKAASKFEGPPALPFVGNGLQFMGSPENILNSLSELSKSYSSPYRLWFGPLLCCMVSDPEQIKAICYSQKTLGKSQVMINCCRPLLGTGMLIAPVEKWKVNRKMIQPTFNPKILDSFVEVFSAMSTILTEQMERHLDKPEFQVFELISACTLDMICETAMGVKVEAQTNKHFTYVDALQRAVAGFGIRLFQVWLYPDFIFHLTQLGRNQRKHITLLHDFTDNVIKMKKKELLTRNSRPDAADNEDDAVESRPRREAFLDHLMKLSSDGANLSDESLRAEVDTMVFAGNETSALADANVMLMLASHPDVQEKVYQELYEIYGDEDIQKRPVTPKDLPRMKYLERVIKETLRLFPVAPVIVRALTDDLNIGEHTLPNGSLTIIEILPMHRNEKYWPDPLKFDPDRFLPEEIAKRHPYAFMAFSAGPRNCIGLTYGMMAMKTLLATVLRRYILKKDNILPVKDIRLKYELLLKPVDPIAIRIERRIKS